MGLPINTTNLIVYPVETSISNLSTFSCYVFNNMFTVFSFVVLTLELIILNLESNFLRLSKWMHFIIINWSLMQLCMQARFSQNKHLWCIIWWKSNLLSQCVLTAKYQGFSYCHLSIWCTHEWCSKEKLHTEKQNEAAWRLSPLVCNKMCIN